jgi:hypothetical protein
MNRAALGLAAAALTAAALGAGEAPVDPGQTYQVVNEQLILLATVVGSIAALPALIEFVVDRRKRRERIDFSIEDEEVARLTPRCAGYDSVFNDNADLIAAVRDPLAYPYGSIGNELLIIGPALAGKKSLAQRLAAEARLERLITVHNPRNADALAAAKGLLKRYARQRVMLLIPNIDRVLARDDDEARDELDALIVATSDKPNVLVVGTASRFAPDSELDNLFGLKLVLPGTPLGERVERTVTAVAQQVLARVFDYYLDRVLADDASLAMPRGELQALVLSHVGNPAEIEDILTLCQTHCRWRRVNGRLPAIDHDVAMRAISRAVVSHRIGAP